MRLWIVIATLAVPCAAWAQQEDPSQRITESERPSFEDPLEQAERGRLEGLATNSAEARLALEGYGRCVVERERDEADRVLTMDFTSSRYRTGLRLLSEEAERNCARDSVGAGNALRSSGLLFSGAMAEALLETDAAPLNARLARNAATEAESYSPTDAIAQCLARSLPDQVAALFDTRPGSEAEEGAAAPLAQAVPICARAAGIEAQVELSVSAMRAMIATAAYRLVAGDGDA